MNITAQEEKAVCSEFITVAPVSTDRSQSPTCIAYS